MKERFLSSITPRSVSLLFVLITLAIAFEYKYHNVFRQASKRLTPTELVVPKYCEQRIIFYPSDWIVPLLVMCVLCTGRRRFTKEMGLALMLPLFAALSIGTSPWSNYLIVYFHLWQLWTMVGIFIAATLLTDAQRTAVLRAVTVTLVVVGSIEALIAITQYFSQHSLGFRWLGEPRFDRFHPGGNGVITVPNGRLWIVDQWLGIRYGTEVIVRAMGTFSHTNVLGGFLMITSLTTLTQFAAGRRWIGFLVVLQLIGLLLTFSRAAIFGFSIGLIAWLFVTKSVTLAKRALPLVLVAACGIGFLFQEQIALRGGLVNYASQARQSDAIRVTYQTAALEMIRQKPVFGIGYEQFLPRIGEFLPSGVDPEKYRGATHNIFLLWAAETGLISASCYLGFFACIGWIGWRKRAEPHVASLLSLLTACLFVGLCDFYLLVFQAGRLMLFLIAGLIAAHRERIEVASCKAALQ